MVGRPSARVPVAFSLAWLPSSHSLVVPKGPSRDQLHQLPLGTFEGFSYPTSLAESEALGWRLPGDPQVHWRLEHGPQGSVRGWLWDSACSALKVRHEEKWFEPWVPLDRQTSRVFGR